MNRTSTLLAISAVGVALAGLVGLPVLVVILATSQNAAIAAVCAPPIDVVIPTFEAEQSANAAVIVSTARREFPAMGRRAPVIAVATAMQESSLRNLDHGDAAGPNSRGLFQQMPEFYPDANVMDPADATRAFLRRLQAVPDWATRQPTSGVIWDVQRFTDTPEARAHYDDKEPAAQAVVDQLWPPDAPDAATGPDAPAAPICGPTGPGYSGPIIDGTYALPLDPVWYQQHPAWFGAPHHTFPAIDIPIPSGTTVYAGAAGVVVSAPAGGTCGNGVIIDGDDGHRYGYCHGERPLVPNGARVRAGDPIMVSDSTGASSGPHLHLQIQRGLGVGDWLCPQQALVAWAAGQSININALPTAGCTT
jgi:murein DD-endopeptidase MepM/ murein hydrolase activator NlpD